MGESEAEAGTPIRQAPQNLSIPLFVNAAKEGMEGNQVDPAEVIVNSIEIKVAVCNPVVPIRWTEQAAERPALCEQPPVNVFDHRTLTRHDRNLVARGNSLLSYVVGCFQKVLERSAVAPAFPPAVMRVHELNLLHG